MTERMMFMIIVGIIVAGCVVYKIYNASEIIDEVLRDIGRDKDD